MAIKVQRLSDLAIEITGYKSEQLEDVMDKARRAAAEVQAQIADDFEGEQAGGSHLLRNTRKYTVRKIIAGFDPRRGHRTGKLQRALWQPGLVSVTQQSKRVLITLLRGRLAGRVPYSDHYADAKARGGNILRVYPELVAIVRDAMRGVSVEDRRDESDGQRAQRITATRNIFGAIAETLGTFFGVPGRAA